MSDSRTRDESVAPRAYESATPSADEVRAELERILASRCFQQATRASNFLRFVTEETLIGGGQRLKGYTIGVEVFGRPADFDAQSDALVRVEAGRLRRRLVEYYAGEGQSDPIKIELPRGSYAVEYHFVDAPAAPRAREPAPVSEPATGRMADSFSWRRVAAALVAVLLGAAGIIAWQHSELREAGRALATLSEQPRTEWPRIVVVPFENLGADEMLDVVAASMTEEIMLRLDELDLFVIASQASWYGPGDERSFEAAAGSYVLTGSVRGSAAEARVTVRLIEADSGAQLWTAAWDQSLGGDQWPTLLEQVGREVATIAAPYGPIFEAELARARRSTEAPLLRDCVAVYHDYRRRIVAEAYRDAVACYERVAARQPDVASVWSGLAMLHVDEYAAGFGRSGDEALDSARAAAMKALALDRDEFFANMALTRVQFFDGDPAFRQSIERTLELRPNDVQALAQGGFLLAVTGDSAHGLLLLQKTRELSKTLSPLCHLGYAVTYLREGKFEKALASALKVDAHNWVVAQAIVAAAAARSGRIEIALEAVQRLRELYPEFETEALANFERWHFDDAFYGALVSGLEEAGIDLRAGDPHLSGG